MPARGDSMFNKLRPTLLLTLAAIIPVIVLSGLLGQHFLREQQHSLDNWVQERALQTAGQLSRELQTQIQLLTILSESPRLDPPLQIAAFRELAERLRLRVPLWELIRVSSPDGMILLSVPQRDGGDQARVVGLASHREVVASGQPAIGGMARGPGGNLAFPIRVPVVRGGTTAYVLSAVIRPEAITSLLYANGLPESWVAWIVDGSGALVTASAGSADLLGGPASAFVASSAAEGPYESRTVEGQGIRAAAAPIAGSNWSLHVGMPLEAYQQPLATAFQLLVLASVLTLGLSGVAGVLFVRELRARRAEERALADAQRLDALGKLTGGVAHDFNNLLMSFQSGIERLKRRRDDEARAAAILDMMLAAVDRGKGMTQRLLAFSRQSGQHSETFRLQDRTEALRATLAQALRDDIALELAIAPDLWAIDTDPEALEVALINLATNARDAMPDGGQLRLRARNLPDAGREFHGLRGPSVAITVTDTGRGIEPADLRRVFDPFFTTKGASAPGLGLSQVYGLAKRSGGMVEASSVVGRGSAFTIVLPRAQTQPPVHAEAVLMPDFVPGKVLVVDDSAAVADASRAMLEEEGFTTLAARSGEEALDLLAAQPDIDYVLSDIMMPGMSGLDLAPRIRRLYPRVGIVLMTGYSESVEKGQRTGFPILTKPFGRQQLVRELALARTEREARAKVVALRRR